jgi:hypothetical protein
MKTIWRGSRCSIWRDRLTDVSLIVAFRNWFAKTSKNVVFLSFLCVHTFLLSVFFLFRKHRKLTRDVRRRVLTKV